MPHTCPVQRRTYAPISGKEAVHANTFLTELRSAFKIVRTSPQKLSRVPVAVMSASLHVPDQDEAGSGHDSKKRTSVRDDENCDIKRAAKNKKHCFSQAPEIQSRARDIMALSVVANTKIPAEMIALLKRNAELEKLVQHIGINTQDRDGETPLSKAIRADNQRMAESLLQNGANPFYPPGIDTCPLSMVDTADELCQPPLFQAIHSGKHEMVDTLLKTVQDKVKIKMLNQTAHYLLESDDTPEILILSVVECAVSVRFVYTIRQETLTYRPETYQERKRMVDILVQHGANEDDFYDDDGDLLEHFPLHDPLIRNDPAERS